MSRDVPKAIAPESHQLSSAHTLSVTCNRVPNRDIQRLCSNDASEHRRLRGTLKLKNSVNVNRASDTGADGGLFLRELTGTYLRLCGDGSIASVTMRGFFLSPHPPNTMPNIQDSLVPQPTCSWGIVCNDFSRISPNGLSSLRRLFKLKVTLSFRQ